MSVIAAALLNLLGVFVSAPLFALLAGGASATAPLSVLAKVMGLMLLPFVIGQLAQSRAGLWVHEYKPLVTALAPNPEPFMAANALAGRDGMQVFVTGNDERMLLCARFDNLGKGASGAAIQCMNVMLGLPETTGLVV